MWALSSSEEAQPYPASPATNGKPVTQIRPVGRGSLDSEEVLLQERVCPTSLWTTTCKLYVEQEDDIWGSPFSSVLWTALSKFYVKEK